MLLFKITALLGVLGLVGAQQIQLPCSNFVSTKESICYVIFQRLEKQIVDSDANLYSLRKVFYPTSQTQPALVNVSYDLTISSVRNRSCPGDPESESNPRYDHLPEALRRFLQVHAWSSKIFYTLFHPATVNRLQPQVLQKILGGFENIYTTNSVPTGLTWNTVGPILTVEVTIDLQLPCWPTLCALEGSLHDLTSVLKVYADSQDNISSWGAEERGYALYGNVFIDQWWKFIAIAYPSSSFLPLVNLILSIIMALMITFGVYYALWNVAPANHEEKNFLFGYSVIWSGVFILTPVNIFLLFIEIESIVFWCQYESSCTESAAEYKIGWIIWMFVYMIIAFVVILVRFLQGKTRRREIFIPEWRAFFISIPLLNTFILLVAFCYKFFFRPLLKVRKIRNLWICFLETIKYCCPRVLKMLFWKIIHFLAIYLVYMTVFVSASIVSFSIVPVLLQGILYPFRTVAAYSYFFAAFALYSLATFMAVFLWKEKPPTTGKLLLYLSSTNITLVFISIISVPFISIYKLLVSGGFSDNPLILFGVSVLPSLLLSSPLVWLFKSKLLPRFLEVDEDEDEDGDSDEEEKKKKTKKNKTKEAAAEDTGDAKLEMETL